MGLDNHAMCCVAIKALVFFGGGTTPGLRELVRSWPVNVMLGARQIRELLFLPPGVLLSNALIRVELALSLIHI